MPEFKGLDKMKVHFEEAFAQLGNTQDRVKWRSKTAVSDVMTEPGGIVSKDYVIQVNPAVLSDKC